MSTTRTIFKNLGSLSAASVVTKLLTLVIVAYVARVLGTEQFGQWSFALTVASYFGVLANLGLDGYGMLELARNRDRLSELVSRVLPLKLIGALVGITIISLIAATLPKPVPIKILIVLCYLPLALGFWNLTWVFIGLERLEFMAFAQVLEQAINLGLVLLVVHTPAHVWRVPIVMATGVAISNLFILAFFLRKTEKLKIRVTLQQAKALLGGSLPIGITGVLSQLYFNFDTVMLSFLRSDREVGWYNAAYRLLAPLIGFRYTIIYSLNPTFARLYSESHSALTTLANRVLRSALYAALPIGVGGTILGSALIKAVFGAGYSEAAIALQILPWSVAMLMLSMTCLLTLYACHRQNTVLVVTVVTVILNIGLNWLLIPSWGLAGAAGVTVGTDVLAFGILYCLTQRSVKLDLARLLPAPAASAAVMGAVLWPVRDASVFVTLPIGVLAYGLMLLATGALTAGELQHFWRQIKPSS